jgi:hypothetical protein
MEGRKYASLDGTDEKQKGPQFETRATGDSNLMEAGMMSKLSRTHHYKKDVSESQQPNTNRELQYDWMGKTRPNNRKVCVREKIQL